MAFKADLKTAFTANFTAPHRNRIMDAFATAYNRPVTVDGQPNPVSKADFAVDRIAEYVRSVVQAEENKAAHAAVVAVDPPTID